MVRKLDAITSRFLAQYIISDEIIFTQTLIYIFHPHSIKLNFVDISSVLAGYSSTAADFLQSEAFDKLKGQGNEDQSETTIQQRTSEISKASLKYQTKEETSAIIGYKGKLMVLPSYMPASSYYDQ